MLFEDVVLAPWEMEEPWRRLGWDCIEGCIVGVTMFAMAIGMLSLREFIVDRGLDVPDVRRRGDIWGGGGGGEWG